LLFGDLYEDQLATRRARRYVAAVGVSVVIATSGALPGVAAADGAPTAITTTTHSASAKSPEKDRGSKPASTKKTVESSTKTSTASASKTSTKKSPAQATTKSKRHSKGSTGQSNIAARACPPVDQTSKSKPNEAHQAWHGGGRKCVDTKPTKKKHHHDVSGATHHDVSGATHHDLSGAKHHDLSGAKHHGRAPAVATAPAHHAPAHHASGGVGLPGSAGRLTAPADHSIGGALHVVRPPAHHRTPRLSHNLTHHASGVASHGAAHHLSGGAGLAAPHVIKPHVIGSAPTGIGPSSGASAVSPGPLTIWDGGFNINPVTAQQLEHFSLLAAKLDQPPHYLVPIYKAAGKRYHIQWQILAAINAIETNYGRDLAVSPAGAIGWMQFMPGTWREFGIAADGNQAPNPYNPRDAIFSAARYLAASGAPRHLSRALFAYNHAWWYVDAVLWRAQLITDLALNKHLRTGGYALPLDLRYMLHLGRTDDGVDVEDAPDGAAVYSMTPGIVTAVASDPTGFGPDYPVIRVTKGPLAGQYIYYGHVAASLVRVGQRVLAGQPIAVMGHTGDAASLGHGHIEIGFSDAAGDPLNHHGPLAWTPSGDAMHHVMVALRKAFEAALKQHSARSPRRHSPPSTVTDLQNLSPYALPTSR
jgi:hypothetical protein